MIFYDVHIYRSRKKHIVTTVGHFMMTQEMYLSVKLLAE